MLPYRPSGRSPQGRCGNMNRTRGELYIYHTICLYYFNNLNYGMKMGNSAISAGDVEQANIKLCGEQSPTRRGNDQRSNKAVVSRHEWRFEPVVMLDSDAISHHFCMSRNCPCYIYHMYAGISQN